jgi:hypothetical protein
MAQSGKRTVTTAGTEVPLTASSQPANCAVSVKALSTNTGLIYLGGPSVSSTDGYELSASEQVILDFVSDLINLWIDSSVNGEGVTWLLLTA